MAISYSWVDERLNYTGSVDLEVPSFTKVSKCSVPYAAKAAIKKVKNGLENIKVFWKIIFIVFYFYFLYNKKYFSEYLQKYWVNDWVKA